MTESANWPEGLHPVRGFMSMCHLLVDDQGAVLLDAGLPIDAGRIRRQMEKLGLIPKDLRAIVLTHGHLDHAGSLAWLKAWTGAPIYAHPAEQAHIDGTFRYRGASRWCGRLERVGRALFGYTPAKIDVANATSLRRRFEELCARMDPWTAPCI